MNFTQLHNHNEYSFLDGFGSTEDWVDTAVELEFKYLGICNHGNVDGVIKFQKACLEKNIEPIIGCELYIVKDRNVKEKGERKSHICVFVKNKRGWKNLLKLLTIGNIDGFYRAPRIDPQDFLNNNEGLVVTSACSSSFLREEWGVEFLEDLMKQKEEDDIFLEVMPHQLKDQKKINLLCLKLKKKYSLKLVASMDCHYPKKGDAICQEALLAIQRKAKWNDPNRWRFDLDNLYLMNRMEMKKAFMEQGCLEKKEIIKALNNTILVAEKCSEFRIEKQKISLPKIEACKDIDETVFLKRKIDKGLNKLFKNNRIAMSWRFDKNKQSLYEDRIEEEFALICQLKFQKYFLIVWDLIRWCKKNDIMIGPGRGSIGGSLIAYCLGITSVDPIKYNLLFFRFISPKRIDLPDIDIDFEDIKRSKIKKYFEEQYGKDNVGGVSTFLRMRGKMAFRDIGRVFDIPYPVINTVAEAILSKHDGEEDSDKTIESAFEQTQEGRNFVKKHPKVARIATALEGQIRGAGQHAAAICISKKSLKESGKCNLVKRKESVLINWEKDDAEYMGFVKFDILGLSALTILNETKKMVEKNHDIKINFNRIDLEDKKVLNEANKGNTVGIFQIGGSSGLADFCKQLSIDSFNDIVDATSLWRPGTLRSGMAVEFVDRKHKRIKWDYDHPLLKNITKNTYGVLLYQEQIMLMLHELAGFEWEDCDSIRKIIAKSKGQASFKKYKKAFVKGCKENEVDASTIERIWKSLLSFGAYGFNKSHAVEYSMISFWELFCKKYYPVEFMACSLTYSHEDKARELINECRRLKILICLPKIGVSEATKWTSVPGERKLFAPFTKIKGVGEKIAMTIIENANHPKRQLGFFKGESTFSGNTSVNKSVEKNLKLIHADDLDWQPTTKSEIKEISKLFSFEIK